MTTYFMFGTYSDDAVKAISAKRTERTISLIKEMGGQFKAGYALLGDIDLVLMVELPDIETAMKTSAALTRLLGVSFSTFPAVDTAVFDKIMG